MTRSHRDWRREAPGTDHPHVLKWLSTAEWVCTPASAVLLYSPGKVEGSGGRQRFDDSKYFYQNGFFLVTNFKDYHPQTPACSSVLTILDALRPMFHEHRQRRLGFGLF